MSKINTLAIQEFYNKRYLESGRSIESVGWSNKITQHLRFDMLLKNVTLEGKSFLDVGCGLGDFIPYIKEKTNGNFSYIGIDISDMLLQDAESHYQGSEVKFFLGDILDIDLPKVDIAINSGALSYKLPGIESYAHEVIKKMFSLSRELAALNFLSTYVDFELEKNQHYSPQTIYSHAKDLSSNVNLIDDYPLYEFSIQIFKDTN
jgi:SAM-dependent methyltransferase